MFHRIVSAATAGILALGIAGTSLGSDDPDVRIARRGAVTGDGLGVVRGTVICPADHPGVTADLHLVQRRGQTEIEGFEVVVLECTGDVARWAVGVRSTRVDDQGNYLFRKGRARATLIYEICDVSGCETTRIERRVVLRRAAG